MASQEHSEYAARERILELLSDEEVAKVSTAEEGVRQVHGAATPVGRVLPRSAVRDATWSRIVSEIGGAAGQPH